MNVIRKLVVIGLGCWVAAQAFAAPVAIRVGYGSAAEEALWLMPSVPQIAVGMGKDYSLDMTLFRGNDQRFQAFESGELDVATGSAHSVILAATQELQFKVVASLTRESSKGFVTQYMVKTDSPLKTVADLKGKSIGINAARSSTDLWARMAVARAGLDPNRDVSWAVVPFPSQGEAVRTGKLDVGVFPQPFAALEEKRGGLRTLFTSRDGSPKDEDLMLLMSSNDFIAKHPDALKSFLRDLVAVGNYYREQPKAAKEALIKAGIVSLPLQTYVDLKDYEPAPNNHIDQDSLATMESDLSKFGFIKRTVPVSQFVDPSFLPR